MTRMLCTFCPPTILGDFYRIPEKLPKSSADKMYRACETKDQTLKKIRTLYFPDNSDTFHIARYFQRQYRKTISCLFSCGGGGVSHKYRAIRCKMGYRTDTFVQEKAPSGGIAPCWGIAGMAEKVSRDRGIAAILSQYRAIWGH